MAGQTATKPRIRAYEMMLLLDVELSDEVRTGILDKIKDTVTKAKGDFESLDEWGRRKLQYEINKKQEAIYYLLKFSCDSDALDEITRVLRITDGVMRAMAFDRIRGEDTVLKNPPRSRDEERGNRKGRGGGGRGGDRGRR